MSEKSTRHPNEPVSRNDADQKNSERDRSVAIERVSNSLTEQRQRYLAQTYDIKFEQVEVIRTQICLNATDAELEYFLATCKRVKLDPFARQIYFIKRKQRVEDDWGKESWVDVGRPEVSIEGLRTSAEQTGEYEGQGPVQWCGKDGRWTDVWLQDEPPHAARATIYRKGAREPMVHVAHFAEYAARFKSGGLMHMWKKMPANQIAKCAEAGGFRKAFPRDLSGLYIEEEMQHTSTGGGFSAPEQPAQQQKQLPNGEAKTIDASAVEKAPDAEPPRDVEKAKNDLIGQMVERGEIDKSMATMLEVVVNAKKRDELNEIAKLVEAAKKVVDKDPQRADEKSIALVAILRPALAKRWKELTLAEKKGGSK